MSKTSGVDKVSTHFEGCEAVHPECAKIAHTAKDNRQNLSSIVNGWIPCAERDPEKDGYYLVYFDNTVTFRYYSFACEWNTYIDKVTHWMPLPEPPECE